MRQGLFKSPDEQVDHADLALKHAALTERDDIRLLCLQEVCWWKSFAEFTDEAAFLPRAGVDGVSLVELTAMTQEEFSRRFKGSAVKPTKRRVLLRNVAVALGNWGSAEAVPVLAVALDDEEPLVYGATRRGHLGGLGPRGRGRRCGVGRR